MAQVEGQQKIQTKFKINLDDVVKIASSGQDRNFSEEVDILQEKGGYEYLQRELFTNFQTGLACDAGVANPLSTPEEQKKQLEAPGRISDWDERNMIFSSNEKPPIESKGFCSLLFDALNDFILKILMVAALVSIIIELATADSHEIAYAWIEGVAILVAVMVCSMVTAINDYQKEKQFQVLNKVADDKKVVKVIRSGQLQIIHQDLVMVGDIVIIEEGMEIPADGIVFEASDLSTDESAMTGETDPIKKNVLDKCIAKRDEIINNGDKNNAGKHDVYSPLIMSGTRVLTGAGKMVVIVVGDSSCLGKIAAILRQKEEPETPLQQKLTKIAEDIGQFGLFSAIAIVFVLIVRFAIERIYENEFDSGTHIAELLDFFIIGITVVVVAIPEGLPLAVTLSLAFSVKKMLAKKNLVRKLQACETMGGANNICSDKTGTLTTNVMTLVKWWSVQIESLSEKDKYQLSDMMTPEFKKLFVEQCGVNTTADLFPQESGNNTEKAILKFLMKTEFDYREIRKAAVLIKSIPFSSKRKRMSVISEIDGKKYVFLKGGSEMVLKSCSKWHNKQNNEIKPIDAQQNTVILDAIKQLADNALRTIGIAYKQLNGNENIEAVDEKTGIYDIEVSDFILMGVFGIADIIRKEVPTAVRTCQKAGIKVRMVTGDNKDTARAIARECGILDPNNPNDMVIEGPDFIQRTGGVVCSVCRVFTCDCPRDQKTAEQMNKPIRVDTIKNQDEFDKIWPYLCVMARSRPEDKYAMVTGLIERGNVVAVTGDGTNDAPALKKADVGFSMGIQGTQVAREASDIILLDDNFNSILTAILWGRNIYDSIKKFLQFQLTVNVVAVSITLISAAIIKQEVLTPIQMLWVNLIMDTFASLALATEPPANELLDRKPHNRNEYIISRKMAKHIIGQSILQLFIILFVLFDGQNFLPEWKSDSLVEKAPELIKDYLDTFDHQREYLIDGAYRYYLKFPYKLQFETPELEKIVSGRLRSYDGLHQEYEYIQQIFITPSRHFTFIFNIFVLLQFFNFLNARKLLDEYNIFSGIQKNYLFPLILLIILGFQIFIVSIGGKAFHCFSYGGLNIQQWLICVGFGVTANFWCIILKMIPENAIFTCKVFDQGKEEQDQLEQQLKGEIKPATNNAIGSQHKQNPNDSYAKQAPEDNEQVEQRDEQQIYQDNKQ